MIPSKRGLRARHVAVAVVVLGLGAAASCAKNDEPNSGFPFPVGGTPGGGAPPGTTAGALTDGGASGAGAPTFTGGSGGTSGTGGGPTGGTAGTGGVTNPCPEGEVWCVTADGFVGCAALGTPEHCAACGVACGAGESCVELTGGGYECTCPTGTRCPAGTGVCVDTTADEANCGGCGITCGVHAECTGDGCGCTTAEFPDAHTNATTGKVDCYDFSADEAHCGDYDTACLPGEECAAGTCTCSAPAVHCPDETTPTVCADLQRDPDNCSACGLACPERGVCRTGACACQPDAPTICGATAEDPGTCADTQTDARFCGAGCDDCFTTVGVNAECVAGTCQCPATYEVCFDPDSGDDTCVDKQTDEVHCGQCANPCGAGEECWGGACVDSPCGGLCAPAQSMEPSGTVKAVGCYELLASQIPNAGTPRLTGWEFKNGFAMELNGVPLPQITQGGDHPLGAERLGGWCIEVTAGSANLYAPND